MEEEKLAIKEGRSVKELENIFDLHYHKNHRLWGIGIKRKETYLATVSVTSRIISFHNIDIFKKEIEQFIVELVKRDMLTTEVVVYDEF